MKKCHSFLTIRLSLSLILLAAAALFFLAPVGAYAQGESVSVIEIGDARGLAAMADNPDGHYRLIADIDLSGSGWKPFSFSGTLDGGGHTIYNLTVTETGNDKLTTCDGNFKRYDTEFAGLFSSAFNAGIHDLHLKGAYVDITGRTNCFAAILTGYADNCLIENCSVSGRVRLKNGGVNAGAAGFIGYGTGKADHCGADVELVFEDHYTEGRCEEFLGGILASGVGSVTRCTVKIDGYVSCHGYVHNGGLVGMYCHTDADRHRGDVSENSVTGRIRFFEDNPDRRAYCRPVIGERLSWPTAVRGNQENFTSDETKDYAKVLSPEQCEHPDYEETITPPDCSAWGYTLHTCRGCGYAWIDGYTPPRHTAGRWVTVSDADTEREGLKRQYCAKCGELMDEEVIGRKQAAEPPEKNPFPLTGMIIALLLLSFCGVVLWFLLGRKRRNRSDSLPK